MIEDGFAGFSQDIFFMLLAADELRVEQ